MKKMGIGLIGCGNISTAYLQLASQFSPLEMRAVADLDMAAAKTQAEKFNLHRQPAGTTEPLSSQGRRVRFKAKQQVSVRSHV